MISKNSKNSSESVLINEYYLSSFRTTGLTFTFTLAFVLGCSLNSEIEDNSVSVCPAFTCGGFADDSDCEWKLLLSVVDSATSAILVSGDLEVFGLVSRDGSWGAAGEATSEALVEAEVAVSASLSD